MCEKSCNFASKRGKFDDNIDNIALESTPSSAKGNNMKNNGHRIFIGLLIVACATSSCTKWQEAKAVINLADSLDQKEHVIYDDTAALGQVIRTLDNPLGKICMHNTLGKAYYYLGRNLEDVYNYVPQAAECYIKADRMQVDDLIYRGRINSCMGHICAQGVKDSLALIFDKRSCEYFKQAGNEWRYLHALINVADCHIGCKEFAEADSLLDQVARYDMDDYSLARYHSHRGMYFYKQDQYDSAHVYYLKTLQYPSTGESKCYDYLQVARTFYDLDSLEKAVPYARYIVENSTRHNFISNAYYILIVDARLRGDVEYLAQCAHNREDAGRALRKDCIQSELAVELLAKYAAALHLGQRVWKTMGGSIILCLVVIVLGIIWYRRRSKTLNQQVEELQTKLEEQKEYISTQDSTFHLDKHLANIRAEYPRPRKSWNDYNELKKDLDAKLHDWLEALDAHGLSNRENVFCVYLLIYPEVSMEKLADWMNYSAKGISTFKRRVALKLGVQTKDLHDYLHYKLYNSANE